MKKGIFTLVFLAIFAGAYAQNEVEALRYSKNYYSGSARFAAMGSSTGAIGADMSVMSTNPAGIALYRKGEVSFTPGIFANTIDSKFNGSKNFTNQKYNFSVGNIGIVAAYHDENASDWKGFSMGFSYNRTNDYTGYTFIEGKNDKGSLLDDFMFRSDGTHPDNLDDYMTYPAFYTYLTDTVRQENGDLLYTNPLWWNAPEGLEEPEYGQMQRKTIDKRGGAGEYAFAMGINYQDFLYLGATMGISSFFYEEQSTHTESEFVNAGDLESFTFSENLRTQGTGVNLKFGVLARPLDFLRIGAAIHTPTFYSIADEYYTSTNSYWYSYSPESYTSSNYRGTYQLTTPLRVVADAGLVIGKFALVSFEYELVDYSTARLNGTNYSYINENQNIRESYQATHNFRGGAEMRLAQFAFRGGFGYFGDPYKSQLKRTDATRLQFSGGFGINTGNLYLDFAYVHTMQKDSYFLYNGYTDEPKPELDYTTGTGMMTIGYRF